MTNKLKFKRTPEEGARHRLKKEKKRKRREEESHRYNRASSSKRPHVGVDVEEPREPERKWASSDEDEDDDGEEQYGPQPAGATSSKSHRRHDAHAQRDIEAEIEDRLFREKLFDNLEDDERLDAVEARLNDFAHVPGRWRGTSEREKRRFWEEEGDEWMSVDPRDMDDEEYAEWVRVGMWRKTHKDEYAEQQRLKALHAARKAEEKARREETKRLEREAEEERRRRKAEREDRKLDYAREEYRVRWARLFEVTEVDENGGEAELRFDDVPWPVAAAQRDKPPKKDRDRDGRHARDVEGAGPGRPITIDDLTESAISSFLLPPTLSRSDSTRPRSTGTEAGAEASNSRSESENKESEEAVRERQRKERKDRLREAFLRFHPDKFEGRFMKRFKEEEREKVREAIGQVSRVLNGLLAQGD